MSFDGGIQQGCITLIVHRAESLVALNSDGTSNPFVTATIGHQSHVTPVVNGSTNPVFDTTFTFSACPLPTILTVKVYNKAAGTGAEELLGSATLTLFSASPFTRRSVQLSHGGNVSLSQKARDGCGTIDISYEVVLQAPQTQQPPANNDLPDFLREDNGPMNFTSAYAAVTAATTAATTTEPPPPPPPPPPQLQPQPKLQLQLPTEPAVPNADFGVPQPHQLQQTQPQLFQQQLQPESHPQAPVVPQLQNLSQQLLCPPEIPAAPFPRQYTFQTTGAPLGTAATPPALQNANDLVTAVTPKVFASPPPPNGPPLQQLPASPSFAVARGIDVPKTINMSNDQYPSAANAPIVPSGQPLLSMRPFTHGASSLDKSESAQQVMNVGSTAVQGGGQPQVPPLGQPAYRPAAAVTPPSTQSTLTTGTSVTPSSTHDSSLGGPLQEGQQRQKQQQQQRQQMGVLSSVPPPVTSGMCLPTGAAQLPFPQHQQQTQQPSTGVSGPSTAAPTVDASTAVKDDEKPKKKVTIMTGTKERPSSAAKAALRTVPLADRAPRHAAASPSRDGRRSSSSGNGVRSSSRGRTSSAGAASGSTSGIHHGATPSAALYQRPDDLLAAAVEGNSAVFQKLRGDDPLLSRGFENVRDYSGRTILHLAAWHGHTEILKILLQPSPAVPMLELRALRSHNGNTVLHSAAQGGQVEVVQWLRFGHPATGTLVGLRNVRGFTATDCAREAGFVEIAMMLDEA